MVQQLEVPARSSDQSSFLQTPVVEEKSAHRLSSDLRVHAVAVHHTHMQTCALSKV